MFQFSEKNNAKKIVSAVKLTPQPCHHFTLFDDFFIFHASTCRFYKIDEAAYRFIKFCLAKSIVGTKNLFLKEGHHPKNTIIHLAEEIQYLVKNGLFDVPDFSVKKKDMEKDIDRIYSLPFSNIELGLAETCNLACKYCYCEQCRELPNNGLMSEKTAKRSIDCLFKASGDTKNLGILFFGGEPLLNKPVIRKVIDYSQRLAKRHGKTVSYSMTTNGTLLDDEFMELVEKYKITVMVSLDGKKDVHDAQCPTKDGRGSYDMAAAGAKRLLAKRAADVRCTMTHPMPDLKELIDFFEQFGFRSALIGGAINMPRLCSPVDFTEADYAEFARQNEAYIPELLERLESKRPVIYNPFSQLLENIKRASLPGVVKCGAGHSCIFASADGALYPCHRFGGMEKWKIGDVSTGVDHDRYKKFWLDYRRSLKHTCEECWAWPVCQGPCPWEVAKPDGTFEKTVRHCDFRKAYVEQAAYIYAWQQKVLPAKGKASKAKLKDGNYQTNRC